MRNGTPQLLLAHRALLNKTAEDSDTAINQSSAGENLQAIFSQIIIELQREEFSFASKEEASKKLKASSTLHNQANPFYELPPVQRA